MSDALEQRIRRYAEAVDATAPPIEDLLPPGIVGSGSGGFAQPSSDRVRIGVRRSGSGRTRTRQLVLASAAAVVALVTVGVVGLSLVRRDSDPGVAVSVQPVPHLFYDADTRVLNGVGWAPEARVEVRLVSGESMGVTTDATGSFVLSEVLGECCTFGAPVVVTDGTSSVISRVPVIHIDRVDPDADIVSGRVDDIDEAVIRLSIDQPGGGFEHTVTAERSAWAVELADVFDFTSSARITASIDLAGVTTTASSGALVAPQLNVHLGTAARLDGWGWLPGADLTVWLDGVASAGGAVDDSGGFEVALDGRGDLAGTVVEVTDGRDTVVMTAPALTYDSFDPATMEASGRSDLPDGAPFEVELWTADQAGGEPSGRQVRAGVFAGGRWQVTFQPLPPGTVVVETDITYWEDDWWVGSSARLDDPA